MFYKTESQYLFTQSHILCFLIQEVEEEDKEEEGKWE